MANFVYGQNVQIESRLVRETLFEQSDWKAGGILYRRAWVPSPLPPTRGIYLGERTLCDGVVANTPYNPIDDYGGERYLEQAKYRKVALVSPGPRRNPVYVELSEVNPIE